LSSIFIVHWSDNREKHSCSSTFNSHIS